MGLILRARDDQGDGEVRMAGTKVDRGGTWVDHCNTQVVSMLMAKFGEGDDRPSIKELLDEIFVDQERLSRDEI